MSLVLHQEKLGSSGTFCRDLVCQVSICTGVEGDGQDEPTWSWALSSGLSAARENTSLVQFLPSPMPQGYGQRHKVPVDRISAWGGIGIPGR